MSKEQREKLSIAASKRMANYTYTKGVGGIRLDIKHYVRSRWEANVARILLYESIEYQYEEDIFVLKKPDGLNLRYKPDFKLQDRYIEVKGWWDSKSKLIKKLMHSQYPHILIEYISEPEYNELKSWYKDKIHEWE
jgi:hypothetical protein